MGMGCLVKDDTGRRALMVTTGPGGISTGSIGFGLGLGGANGRIDDLLGWFGNLGGSVTVAKAPMGLPIGLSAGGEFSCSASCSTIVVQVQGAISSSLVEVHGSATNTWIEEVDLDAPAFAPVWVLLNLVLALQGLA
jgi:hypothetical protein